MLTTTRGRLQTLAALVVVAVLCELVAHSTHHRHGFAHAISWVAFVGFWAALAGVAGLLLLLVWSASRRRPVG